MLDQSGNGNHATQTVSGSRPIYRTDGTLYWLEFDGVNQFLLAPTLLTAPNFGVFAGVKSDDLSQDSIYFSQGLVSDRSSRLLLYSTRTTSSLKMRAIFGDSGSEVTTPTQDLNPHVYSTRFFANSTSKLQFDANIEDSFSSTPTVLVTQRQAYIGTLGRGGYEGSIYGLIVSDSIVSDENTTNIIGYLSGLAGLTL